MANRTKKGRNIIRFVLYTTLMPYACELIQLLHQNGYKIAVITNGTSDLSNHPSINSLIDAFVSPEICGDSKPSVIPFHMVLTGIKLSICRFLRLLESLIHESTFMLEIHMRLMYLVQCVLGGTQF